MDIVYIKNGCMAVNYNWWYALQLARPVNSVLLQQYISECGSTLYVGMALVISFSLYIGIGATFQNKPIIA